MGVARAIVALLQNRLVVARLGRDIFGFGGPSLGGCGGMLLLYSRHCG